MRNIVRPLFAALPVALLIACGGTDPAQTTSDEVPDGQVTTIRSGLIQHQDGPATSGSIKIVRDVRDRRFIELGDDFKSDFATGTVTLYFAKSDANLDQQRAADPSSVSALVAPLEENGFQYHAMPESIADDGFTHAILWCNTAKINFGAARLQ